MPPIEGAPHGEQPAVGKGGATTSAADPALLQRLLRDRTAAAGQRYGEIERPPATIKSSGAWTLTGSS